MGHRSVILTLAAVSLAVVAGACGGKERGGAVGGASAAGKLDVSTAGWKTDFSKHTVPLSEFQSGGPKRDAIPPIDGPKTVSPEQAEQFLDDREPVLVARQRGAVRAYPIQILIWHEIVNDELGGRAIAVTYCPLCNSSVVFDRRVGARALTFGTTGNLRMSDLVMWDRQTESWWQQLSGEAVAGELSGKRLEVLPSQTLSWADFRRSYPHGDVLSRDTGFERDYGANPYEGYDERDSRPFLFNGKTDDRLPPKEYVAAVFVDETKPLVVPFSRLVRESAVNAASGATPLVVLYKRGVVSPLDAAAISRSKDVGTSAAFDRRVGRRTLEFQARDGGYVDRQTGSRWDITGQAVAGPLEGKRLRPLRHDQQFWFALAAFLPGAEILG
ncbi:MAG: DUF3179 domain-containing protein [Thermoleophilaceae bacterium]|nr:DUF3179 domain-containing protein [Thermoleophilaceae bacterium]